MTATQETDPTSAALALLSLPDPETLSEPQMCGRACVWCRGALSNDSAIDLGKRTSNAHGTTASWFPRACGQCVAAKAYATLFEHAPLCEQCVDDADACETGIGLRRLMRKGRR